MRAGRAGPAARFDRLAVLVLAGAYLALALPYLLLTPAWEPNDELYHAMYVEDVLAHWSFPRIALSNGIESHQPPLYYLMEALWQWLAHIPVFKPSASPIPGAPPRLAPGPFLTYWHHYTPVQHTDAFYVHELRALSMVLGLLTVLFSYACARLVLTNRGAALAAGLTVALLPKELVVSTAISNDSLVITLCALALLVSLLAEGARRQGRHRHRRALMAGLGATLGLAALAKFNSLPLAGVLLGLSWLPVAAPGLAWRPGGPAPARRLALAVDGTLAVACFVAVSGWWFARDHRLYGQFLASRATQAYLSRYGYGLVSPVPWTDLGRFLRFVPSHLYHSLWYDGSGNQWLLPNWMNNLLWVAAALSGLVALSRLVKPASRRRYLRPVGTLACAQVVGALVAGLAAVLIIAKTTTQAEGRIAFTGLAAFAAVLALGTMPGGRPWGWPRAALALGWPLVLVAVNAWVIATYVVPLGGL